MDDNLLDQIASRFGRASLIIENSSIYKKMKGAAYFNDGELDNFDKDGKYIGLNASPSGGRATFRERFERYMQSLMGSANIYCCPLCFIEAGDGGVQLSGGQVSVVPSTAESASTNPFLSIFVSGSIIHPPFPFANTPPVGKDRVGPCLLSLFSWTTPSRPLISASVDCFFTRQFKTSGYGGANASSLSCISINSSATRVAS